MSCRGNLTSSSETSIGKSFYRRNAANKVARESICARALNTNDGTRCVMKANYDRLYRVAFPETLPDYLHTLGSRITNFNLPLGASIDMRSCGEIVLQVPKVTFLDLFVYPTSTLAISGQGPNDVEITAIKTEIHGSHHVESLNCNDRFELHLKVNLASENDLMHSAASFKLEVDVPFPLNLTPKPAVEATGNLAVQRTLDSLMDTLCASVVRDQATWHKEVSSGAREELAKVQAA